jgi:hypothetical protein
MYSVMAIIFFFLMMACVFPCIIFSEMMPMYGYRHLKNLVKDCRMTEEGRCIKSWDNGPLLMLALDFLLSASSMTVTNSYTTHEPDEHSDSVSL